MLQGRGPPRHPPSIPSYLRFLPKFIFRTDRGLLQYTLRGLLLAVLPAVVITTLLMVVDPLAANAPGHDLSRTSTFVLMVIIGPFLETALMGVILMPLRRLCGTGPAAVISAVLWGILHGSVSVRWGITVAWPFLILSLAFLTWRHVSLRKAFTVAFLMHALQNAAAATLFLAMNAL